LENIEINLNKKAGVYKIKNLKNNKVYIGSSIDLQRRKRSHICCLKNNTHTNSYLQDDFNKYGIDNFKFVVIEFVEKTKDNTLFVKNMLEIEQCWIDKFNSSNRELGYNKSPIAGSTVGVKWTEESRLAFSEKRKKNPTRGMLGMNHSQQTKNRMSEYRKGKPISEETKQNISNANKGRKPSIKAIEEARKYHLGRKRTDEEKRKISKAMSGANNPRYGKKHSKKSKELIAKSKYKKVINLDTGEIFESAIFAADAYGIKSRVNIANACRKEGASSGGYHWQYYEEYLKEHPEDTDLKGE